MNSIDNNTLYCSILSLLRFSNRLFEKLKIKSGRIFISGDNLLTWSGLLPGIDPEQGASSGNTEPYPMTQNFNLGINLNF